MVLIPFFFSALFEEPSWVNQITQKRIGFLRDFFRERLAHEKISVSALATITYNTPTKEGVLCYGREERAFLQRFLPSC